MRDSIVYIEDIMTACSKIMLYTQNITFETFSLDDKTIDAVIRNFDVIGEAARHVDKSLQMKYNNIPWREMMTMRNILIHEYFGVNKDILWKTATESIPSLLQDIQKIIDHEQ